MTTAAGSTANQNRLEANPFFLGFIATDIKQSGHLKTHISSNAFTYFFLVLIVTDDTVVGKE